MIPSRSRLSTLSNVSRVGRNFRERGSASCRAFQHMQLYTQADALRYCEYPPRAPELPNEAQPVMVAVRDFTSLCPSATRAACRAIRTSATTAGGR